MTARVAIVGSREPETFRCRIYSVDEPEEARVIQQQCAHCWKVADDCESYENGEGRAALLRLRERLALAGWTIPVVEDADAKSLRDASCYCSDACARGDGPSAMEKRQAERFKRPVEIVSGK